MTPKRVCEECHWQGTDTQQLEASNPFNPEDVIVGCPECYSINTLRVVCDERDCWDTATCGTPTEDGYRNVCGKHYMEITDHEAISKHIK